MTAPTVSPTRPAPAIARAPRPRRAQVPALPPLEALDRTHQRMMDMLVALQHLVEHLADHGVDTVARREAKTICGFFANTARRHHADEEALVFPALVRGADPILVQHVLRLQQDHGWLEEDWLELAPQLQAIAEGYSWYELDTLRHGAGVFTALYHEHIALEESLIYPEARRQLAREETARQQRLVDQAATGSAGAG